MLCGWQSEGRFRQVGGLHNLPHGGYDRPHTRDVWLQYSRLAPTPRLPRQPSHSRPCRYGVGSHHRFDRPSRVRSVSGSRLGGLAATDTAWPQSVHSFRYCPLRQSIHVTASDVDTDRDPPRQHNRPSDRISRPHENSSARSLRSAVRRCWLNVDCTMPSSSATASALALRGRSK